MNESDVAYLLAYIESKFAYKSGLNRVEATEATVRSWKSDLDHGNCRYPHIALRAIDEHFRSDAGKYGITPGELVIAYRRIAGRLVDNLAAIVPETPPDDVTAYLAERRRMIDTYLANPANMATLDNPRPAVRIAGTPMPPELESVIRQATPKLTKQGV